MLKERKGRYAVLGPHWAFSPFFSSWVFRMRGEQMGVGVLNPLHWLTAVISFIRSWHPSSDCKAKANRTRKSSIYIYSHVELRLCLWYGSPTPTLLNNPPLITNGWAGPWWDNWIASLKQIGLGVCRTEQPWTPSWAGKVERKSGKRPLRACICIINKGQTAGLVWLWGLVLRMCQCKVLHGPNTLFTNERISQGHFLCFKVLLSSLWSCSTSCAL